MEVFYLALSEMIFFPLKLLFVVLVPVAYSTEENKL